MSNKILVIGGLGYCGTALVDYLCNSFKITVVDTNSKVFKNHNVNYINGKYQNLPETFFKEFTDIILLTNQYNVIDNIKNFTWLIKLLNKNQKFIYTSILGSQHYDIDKLCELNSDNLHFYGLKCGKVNGFSRNLRKDVIINMMCFNAKNNSKIFLSKNDVNIPILGINDLCRSITTIIHNGSFEKSGVYNLNSFKVIANNVSKIFNVNLEDTEHVNLKLQKNYEIDSSKFIKIFDFKFKDTLESITNELLIKWDTIQNFENILDDQFLDYKIITKCRVCDKKTTSLLDLNSQPLANNYTKFCNKLDYNPVHINLEETYPLHLHYCENCFHVQLNCIVNPEKFKDYITCTRNTLEYFKIFALSSLFRWDDYNENKKYVNEIKILEISNNDCSQLDAYRNLSKMSNINITTVGVDPLISKKKEHDIYCEIFGRDTVDKLNKKYGISQFDIIVVQNLFSNLENVNEFLTCTKELLSEKGILLIQTSKKNLILENNFDSVYHKHLNFFNTNSMKLLCEKNGLFLNNVTEHSIHGTSYIFEITKKLSKNSNVLDVILKEAESGLYDKTTYLKYSFKCLKYKNNLHNKLIDYKLSNKNIIGFGSTTNLQTCLNFIKIDSNIIDYIIDENKLKQNLFTPGSNILITDISLLKTIEPNTVILITAWDFYKEILEKIQLILTQYKITFPVEICNIKTLENIIIN